LTLTCAEPDLGPKLTPITMISRKNSWRAFLYRRLARWITCEVRLLGRHPLALDNKFQVNSLQDVFCSPFYWQLYSWVQSPPNLVVDLGAHCAHFSMLADICFRARFGEVQPEYVLIEPNPRLMPVIIRNLRRSGLCPRNLVRQGLVGATRTGRGTLWVSSKNFLSASLQQAPATRGVEVDYIDLEAIIGGRPIDLLKIDIEGAEYDFVDNYPDLLEQARVVLMEIHQAPEERQRSLFARLSDAGLRLAAKPLRNEAFVLAMFRKSDAAESDTAVPAPALEYDLKACRLI